MTMTNEIRELTDAELDSVHGARVDFDGFGSLFGLTNPVMATHPNFTNWQWGAFGGGGHSTTLTPTFVAGVFGNPDHIS